MTPLTKPTIYLVRHGDTQMNDANVLRGWDDPPLNAQGHEDAHKAAAKIVKEGVPLHHIYTGTLKRTEDTGRHVSAMTGVKHTALVGLNPWDYGDLTGQKENHAARKKLKFFQDRPEIKTPNGESYQDFLDRFGGTLKGARDYVEKYPDKALVLVTHSRNLYPVEHILDGESKIPTKDVRFNPSSVHKLEFDEDGKHKLTKI